ncbi:DUF1049 domain-containing protein [Paenibacillus athensensis]|uniref:Lipopolysaccharide assembly protein A domain-containing protein n=1 Tax=Paenibacillus athensensis TaxID=1967502 RepID=A0A4Y8Q9F2_9BACL|nr:lipopolysaccharide assembly protein LapA domain-containing protein [Paenibacillus athensensis]MCD1259034.1 DUF1049 domain-containing protein [Paenibacillus athensensis]
MRVQWTLICALVFALLTAVFAVSNVEAVQVNLLFGDVSLPLILVILTSTLLGGLIVGLFGIIRQYKLQRRMRLLERLLREHGLPLPGEAAVAAVPDTEAAMAQAAAAVAPGPGPVAGEEQSTAAAGEAYTPRTGNSNSEE